MALAKPSNRNGLVAVPPAKGTARTRVARGAKPAAPARWRQPRYAYTALFMAGAALIVAGVGLIYLPAALVLAGLALGGLGFVGLGMQVRPR